MSSEANITNLFSLIKTDEQLTEAALRIFEEFEEFHPEAPQPQQYNNSRRPSEISVAAGDVNRTSNHPSPSIRLQHHIDPNNKNNHVVDAEQYDNQYYCEYDDHFHYPHQHHISFEELERKKAEKWLNTVKEHNRDFTFSPAICQKSLDLITAKKQQQHHHHNGSQVSTRKRRSTSAGVSRRPTNDKSASSQHPALKHYFNSHQSSSSRTNSPKQQQQQRRNSPTIEQEKQQQQQQEKDVDHDKNAYYDDDDDDNVVNRLYYQDAQKRKQMEEERAIVAEANRLLRQRELILNGSNNNNSRTTTTTTPSVTRATTPKRTTTTGTTSATTPRTPTANNACTSGITSPQAREPFQRQQPHTSNNHHQSSSRGISACERLYYQSQQRPNSISQSNSRTNSKKQQDPALFERLYSEASKIQEIKQQRIEEATHIRMKQLDPYEVDSMLERVHDSALMERNEHMKSLNKQFTPSFHPSIEVASARMVTSRNSAAGDVFHRLATKPPNEH